MFVEGDRVRIEPPPDCMGSEHGTVAGMIGDSVVVVVVDQPLCAWPADVELVHVDRCEHETP